MTTQPAMTNVALPITPQGLAELRAELERRRMLRPPDLAPHLSLVDLPGHKLNVLTKAIRHIFLKGGRGSAKSWAVAEVLIKLARTSPLRILCTREYQNSIADSVHKLLSDTITRLGLDDWFAITLTSIKSKAGAEFLFKGLHNNSKEIKSTEGVDICWVEEGQSISKESLEFLLPTIRASGSRLIFTYNPENDNDPIHVMALNPPEDSVTVHVNFDENPYFSKELEQLRQWYLKRIEDAETDVERAQAQSDYDHIWLGETKKINDEIIFSGKCVVQEFPDDLWKKAERVFFGADFGFSRDPATLLRFFIVEEVLYIEYEAHGVGVELDEMDQFYEAVPGSRDWPIKGDSSRPETISHIRGFGFNISAADKWPGSVEDGISHIRAFKKIIIHTRCKHTAQEAKMYKYKKDRITGEVLKVIIDKHNHCWDAIRYGLDGYIQRRGNLGVWAKLGGGK
jgi:phage terminase large subunit